MLRMVLVRDTLGREEAREPKDSFDRGVAELIEGRVFVRLPFVGSGRGGGAMALMVVVGAVLSLGSTVGRRARRSVGIFGCVGVTVRLLHAFDARRVSL
jgi:hypothetical protein